MSMFRVSVIARNTKDESLVSQPIEAIVDTGSELTWLPKELLDGIKVTPVRKRSFTTATKQLVTRETGYAILTAEGFETVDEVVFAEPGDLTLLGVRTIEGFGVMVDNIAHRFVATTTIVAALQAIECPRNRQNLSFSGYTTDMGATVIFGRDDAEPLLGVTPLESVGIEVDPQNQRLKRLPAVRLK